MTQTDTSVRPAKPPAHMPRSPKAGLEASPASEGSPASQRPQQGGLAQLKVTGRQGVSCLIAQAAGQRFLSFTPAAD